MNTDRHSNVEKEFTNVLKLAVIFVGNINKIIEYNTCKCLRRIPFSLYLLLISKPRIMKKKPPDFKGDMFFKQKFK